MGENRKGFAFYANYWDSIQSLSLEQQKEVCYAIARYGITGELVDAAEMPIGFAMTQGISQSIDNSVARWELNSHRATEKQDSLLTRDMRIAELCNQGLNSREIGEKIGVSEATVRRSPAWKNRTK